MILIVKKGVKQEKLNDALRRIEHPKRFNSSAYLGKIKWNEDALLYQKRIRSEWD